MSPIATASPTTASVLNTTSPATTSSKGAMSATETTNRFITLLVAQMKNQDPLSPMDNAAVTSQMAQLSTVSGIDKLNTTLDSLKTNMQTTGAMQATGMIGHGVMSTGSTISLLNSTGSFGVNLANAADDVRVVIHDASGAVVRTMDLGSQAAGVVMASWDGKTDSGGLAADDKYTFSVKAVQSGSAVAATPMTYGVVTSVSTGPLGTKLNLANHQSINLSDVSEII
jgi:flagellar basal-body rod modification protein FlgD